MRELLAGLVPGLPETPSGRSSPAPMAIPLYAVETVRMLVAEGRLSWRATRYRPGRGPGARSPSPRR